MANSNELTFTKEEAKQIQEFTRKYIEFKKKFHQDNKCMEKATNKHKNAVKLIKKEIEKVTKRNCNQLS